MKKLILYVMINGKPHHFTLLIEKNGIEILYHITHNTEAIRLEDFVPANPEFYSDEDEYADELLWTVEGAEITKLIWQAIDEQLED